MRSFNCLLLIGNVVAGSYLAIIEDNDGENNCRVWSQNNHGCTGYSATFAKLKGKDCSGEYPIRIKGPHAIVNTL